MINADEARKRLIEKREILKENELIMIEVAIIDAINNGNDTIETSNLQHETIDVLFKNGYRVCSTGVGNTISWTD